MVYLIMILIVIIVLLVLYVIRCHHEVKHLTKQLKTIKNGSHIKLTSQVHTKDFSDLYLEINQLITLYQEKQFQNQKTEEELKMTIQNMAHDLRTPLTSSIGYMQMMRSSHDKEKKERYLSVSLQKMQELKDMLEELFLYTKLTSDQYHLDLEKISLYPLFTKVILSFYDLFQKQNKEPMIFFDNELMMSVVNQEALERVFQNIIYNALIHGDGDLSVYQHENKMIFKNTMKENYIPSIDHVFDRFYKADQSRNRTSSGLGLAIVKEFMEKMGGHVHAYIKENEFIIELIFHK
ncbi:MAG: HAMP domain-containing sensor histidine kinase [Coprobacillus sp.]